MDSFNKMVGILNEERRLHGESNLSSAEIESVRDYYESKFNELKATSGYKEFSEKDKQEVYDLVFGKLGRARSMPTCSINSNNGGTKVMNEKEQINSFRGLGYDDLIDDGLSKDLSADKIALNILHAMPANRYIEQERAINLLVEAAKNITNKGSKELHEAKNSNVSEEQRAVNLLVNAAKSITGGTR